MWFLNLHFHYAEDFFFWLFYTMQLFCWENLSSQWFCFICLSTLFFEHHFLHDNVFMFSICCLYSAWLWMCWFILKVLELYSYKVVFWACCCWKETNLILCQNHLFMKDSELIAESCWIKDLISCWRTYWWYWKNRK